MLDSFTLRVLLSFVVAGTWITLATILSERLGTKLGGLLCNLPSTIVVSLLFIGWTQNASFAAEAAKAAPIGMLAGTAFLFVYILGLKRFGNTAAFFALAAWELVAIPIGLLGDTDLVVGVLLYAIATLAASYYLEKRMRIPSLKKRDCDYSIKELLLRAVVSGGIVAIAVTIAALGGPVWAGLFSVFPAVMFSTMLVLTNAQGRSFAQATGKVMLPASANIVVYGLAVYLTYPVYGLVVGTLVSYATAAGFVLLIYPIMKRVS